MTAHGRTGGEWPTRDEWQLGELLADPQRLFVLWCVNERFCRSSEDFQLSYGSDFPIQNLVAGLQNEGWLTEDSGLLALSEKGKQAVRYLAENAIEVHSGTNRHVSKGARTLGKIDEHHPSVLISYSHDSEEHAARVRLLADRLRADGVDCTIDQYGNPPQGWPAWMEQELDRADFVLVVYTGTYARRAMGNERPGVGLGVGFESILIRQDLYDAAMWNEKYIPVIFDAADSQHIVKSMRGFTHYQLESEHGYEELYRRLTNQPLVRKPPLGPLKVLPAPARPAINVTTTTSNAVTEFNPPIASTAVNRTATTGDTAPIEPPPAQVGRRYWPELMKICYDQLAPVVAKFAEHPRFVADLHQANLEAGLAAVRHGLNEEDADVLFQKENLKTFSKLVDEFRTDWLSRIKKIDQPRRNDVEKAFFLTIESRWNRHERKLRILALFLVSVIATAACSYGLYHNLALGFFAGAVALGSLAGAAYQLLAIHN